MRSKLQCGGRASVWACITLLIGANALLMGPGRGAQPLHAAEPPSNACAATEPLVPTSPPMRRSDVEELKGRLFVLGFYYGNIDEVYDGAAQHAVLDFQASRGLIEDGVVDDTVWAALAEVKGSEVTGEGAGSPTERTASEAAEVQNEPPPGERSILIDTHKRRLTLLVDGEPFQSYPVAVGRDARRRITPVGEWRIANKARWGGGFGTRWMGLNVPWGTYGIHGTNKPWSVGTHASSGCIRMFNRHVEELYSLVDEGTRVKIVGTEPTVVYARDLKKGMTGRDVVQVQLRLRELGFDIEEADGRYGAGMADAVRRLQEAYGLPVDGVAYTDVFTLLGLERWGFGAR